MEKVKLGEIFEYLPKSTFKAGDGKEKGKYKFFTSSNIQNKFIDEFIYDGEYLIFGTGGKAAINYCNGKFSTSTDNFVVRVNEKFSAKLIFLYFKNDMKKLENGFKGASIKHISKEYINKLSIPNYDYKQQLNIVIKLDKIQEAIDIRKKQIEEIDKLIKSQFIEMFGDPILNNKNWRLYKWNDVLTIKNGKNQKKVEKQDGKYPIYGSGGIMSYASDYICNEDSVIIGRKGNINNPILVRIKFWNVDTAFGLEPNKDKMIVEYLYYFCYFYNFEKHNKAVTIPSLTKSDLLNIDIPIPDIHLQNQFAEFVKQIDKRKLELQNSLKELQKLQESLMNEYFG